jgi:hypothetical protein
MMQLPEHLLGLPDIWGSEDFVAAPVRESCDEFLSPLHSDADFSNIKSANS